MLFYFTATGNSLHTAKQLEERPISIAQAIHDRDKTYVAESIGIVCPVFGHEVPGIVKEFLESANFQTPYFYMILTYGNRHGGASELAERMLSDLGITASYINVVLMVDNFLPGFDMDQQKALDKNVEGQIEIIKNDLAKQRRFISPVTAGDRKTHQEYLARMSQMPVGAFSNLCRITEQCVGCEICTKVCPKACFTVSDQKSIWHSEGCITCMACVHACPTKAIQLSVPEKNQNARYRNEHISLCEIVDSNNQLNKITE